MSLKQEIESWVAALAHYDTNEFDDALVEFDKICDTSKILFNMGVIRATLGEHGKAVECYQRAIGLDKYLAVAYFQQGVSNFLLGEFQEALSNFNDTLLYLRGNTIIDYAQLGLLFKLYSCEVLFNRGLCYINLQQKEAGMQDLTYAGKEKLVDDHDVIDEAIREHAEGYTVFSIPVGVVYRPNEAKVRNLQAKDYLGKARLVAASDQSNAFTGFAGLESRHARGRQAQDDRSANRMAFAATHILTPELQSTRRQRSEPPTSRDLFPPTPPPEAERARRGSNRSGLRPLPAMLQIPSNTNSWKLEMTPSVNGGQLRAADPSCATSGGFSTQRDLPPVPTQPRFSGRSDDFVTQRFELYDLYQSSSQALYSRRRLSSNLRALPPAQKEDKASLYDERLQNDAMSEMSTDEHWRTWSFAGSHAQSSNGDFQRLRIKVHTDDVRCIMVGIAIEFPDLVVRLREKFRLRDRFKIQVIDEDMPNGDMITVADQDDLDMAIQSAKVAAKRLGHSEARMEVRLPSCKQLLSEWQSVVGFCPVLAISQSHIEKKCPCSHELTDWFAA